jgi:PEP-CTERM motif
MKKLILSAIALTSAANIFAQGTVLLNNRIAGGTALVFGPNHLLIGTVGGMTASTTFATLIGAPGSNAPESLMLPSINPPTIFRTGAGAGSVVTTTDTFSNILPDAPVATFEMVAWDNSTGLYPTWAQASVAVENFLIIGGASAPFVLQNIGGTTFTPPLIVSSIPGQGLQSFGIGIPEPTTVALAGLGAAALLIFRRRK